MSLYSFQPDGQTDFNEMALLWGEANLCFPYVCSKKGKKLPIFYIDPMVTYV